MAGIGSTFTFPLSVMGFLITAGNLIIWSDMFPCDCQISKIVIWSQGEINANFTSRYLTILGLTVAYATFVIGLLADITLSPTLFFIKNTLSLCSAPLEVLISLLYWSISAIDKRLLIPEEVELAPIADVGFHLMPSLLLTIDLLLLSPPWTIHAFPAMGLSASIAVAYWAWIERCYKFNGL